MWGSAKFSLQTLTTISWLPEQAGECTNCVWGGPAVGPTVLWASSSWPVICRQAEIAKPRCWTTVYSLSEGRGRGHATVFTSTPTLCGWSLSLCWNTMAAPDTAHSHTVLPHWKSYKTRVIRAPRLRMIYFSVSSQVTLHLHFCLPENCENFSLFFFLRYIST